MRYLYRVLILGLILFNYSFASDTLLTMNSYGPVKIGMTSNQAYTSLSSLGQVNKAKLSSGCSYYNASEGVSFMLDNNKIVRIEISIKEALTPSGIRVGDSLEKLKKTFLNGLLDEPHHYLGAKARTVKLFSKNGKIAMRFEVYDNHIAEIYSGYEHSIHFVEGCS